MTKKPLTWCVQCNVLALFSPLDQAPEYHNEEGQWKVVERDDQAAFMHAHRRHHLEELYPIEGSFISSQDYAEPTKTSYFEVTNGRQRFVVKRVRKSILDAQRYELIPGKLRLKPSKPRIDCPALQRELAREFARHMSSAKIDRFVQNLAEAVSYLDPRKLKRAPFESHNPSLWYFILDQRILGRILRSSSQSFTEREVKLLQEFFRRNQEDPGFMAAATVEFQIEKGGDGEKTQVRPA
ncbi:MAG: hypothetical protein GTN74_14260 [Proteobacteria bacterium]|nr:hypothetical protein [Pseudomonadota bacterium]NIS71694.1 hypothetical protein [Pseudomonadota bacterium]